MTSLKKVTASVALGLMTAVAFVAFESPANAQVFGIPMLRADTASCEVYTLNGEGEWHRKALATRRSERPVVGKLAIKFDADRFDEIPVQGYIALFTDTKPRKLVQVWDVTIQDDWKFNVETQTEFGAVQISCSL